MYSKKIVFIVIGCISFALGAIGVMVPLLPSFPFLLLASVCFGKSSKRLDVWFKSTNIYKNHLESYVRGDGMTKKTKVRIMLMVTALLGIGFVMMYNTPMGQGLLLLVWLGHIMYFCIGVKTIKPSSNF